MHTSLIPVSIKANHLLLWQRETDTERQREEAHMITLFCFQMVSSFCPSQPQLADGGIKAALRDILNKNVLLYVCVCVHTCMYVCMYVCVHMYVCTYVCICAYICMDVCVCVHTCVQLCV